MERTRELSVYSLFQSFGEPLNQQIFYFGGCMDMVGFLVYICLITFLSQIPQEIKWLTQTIEGPDVFFHPFL